MRLSAKCWIVLQKKTCVWEVVSRCLDIVRLTLFTSIHQAFFILRWPSRHVRKTFIQGDTGSVTDIEMMVLMVKYSFKTARFLTFATSWHPGRESNRSEFFLNQVSSSLHSPMIVALWSVAGFAYVRGQFMFQLYQMIPNGRFPGHESVWKSIFFFTCEQTETAQKAAPAEMLLYRLQSSGPDPDKKNKRPHILYGRTLWKMLFPFVQFCFSHCIMHEVLEYLLLFVLFFSVGWPDVVYLNFMYRNDLVTCVRYNKVTMKITEKMLHHVLSLNNCRGNIFLYF